MLFSKREIQKVVQDAVTDAIKSALVEIDPNKHYILVVPSTFPMDELKRAFAGMDGKMNLTVLQSDNIRLLELGG